MRNRGKFRKEYAHNGVYIYTENESLIVPKFWGLYEIEKPVGAAIIGGRNLLVALTGSEDSLTLLDSDKELVSTKYEDIEEALTDQNGVKTTADLAELGSPAALFCKEYKAGGFDWYLPTLADFQLMYDNKKELDIALAICGGNMIETDNWHWISTRRHDQHHWFSHWSYGYHDLSYQDFHNRVRPVSKL